ncbi:MAG: hypothetical protein RI900_2401, partial [Actinomycetota bacterium]
PPQDESEAASDSEQPVDDAPAEVESVSE